MLTTHLYLATRLRTNGATRILPIYALVALTDTTFVLNLYQFVKIFQSHPVIMLYMTDWDGGGTVVKVLCYKSGGRWFDPRWCHWNFSLT